MEPQNKYIVGFDKFMSCYEVETMAQGAEGLVLAE